MTTRKKCSECNRPIKVCLCSSIIKQSIDNKILILQDKSESEHPFNTAKFASLGLDGCNLTLSDEITSQQIENFKSEGCFLLFKTQDSKPLKLEGLESKNFIVLDGTWRKARRILHEWSELNELQTYHLETQEKTIYQSIRKSCGDDHLSTLEAIGITLKELNEIDESGYLDLLNPLKTLLDQQKKWAKKAH